jgi:hypothetical protein
MTTVHVSFSHVAQRLPIAPPTTSCTPLHVHASAAVLQRVGSRRHPSLCGRTRAPAGSALSWTPRVSSARITEYGRAPTVLVSCQQQPLYKLEMPDSSHCQCHCPAHYTSHYCGEPCCPQCMGQRSRDVLSEILYSKYC